MYRKTKSAAAGRAWRRSFCTRRSVEASLIERRKRAAVRAATPKRAPVDCGKLCTTTVTSSAPCHQRNREVMAGRRSYTESFITPSSVATTTCLRTGRITRPRLMWASLFQSTNLTHHCIFIVRWPKFRGSSGTGRMWLRTLLATAWDVVGRGRSGVGADGATTHSHVEVEWLIDWLRFNVPPD